MRCTLLSILMLTAAAFAQPLQGPFTLSTGLSPISGPRVVLDGSTTAHVFFQNPHSILALDAAVASGQVVTPPAVILQDPSRTLTIADACLTDDGWWLAATSANDDFNSIDVIAGPIAAPRSLYQQSTTVCHGFPPPPFGSCGTYHNATLGLMPDGSPFACMQQSWAVNNGTFSEGGLSLITVRFNGDGTESATTMCETSTWIMPPLVRAVSADSIVSLFSSPYETYLSSTNGDMYFCHEITSFNCSVNPKTMLWTRGGRLFCLTSAGEGYLGAYSAGIVELAEDSCHWIQTAEADPIAAASHPDYGIAWLAGGDTELYLFRADTLGNPTLPAGLMAQPMPGGRIQEATLAINAAGLLTAVWTEQSLTDTSVNWLRMASVGWSTTLDGSERPAAALPASLALSAYPNPFNSALRITINLEHASDATLSVFNLAGQQVAQLQSGRFAAGEHQFNWSPDQLSSALYFVSLATPQQTRTIKTVYLR